VNEWNDNFPPTGEKVKYKMTSVCGHVMNKTETYGARGTQLSKISECTLFSEAAGAASEITDYF